jgi:hypothetical protein
MRKLGPAIATRQSERKEIITLKQKKASQKEVSSLTKMDGNTYSD